MSGTTLEDILIGAGLGGLLLIILVVMIAVSDARDRDDKKGDRK